MNKQDIYDRICRVLTNFEENEPTDDVDCVEWMNTFYDLLVDIQNGWETVITSS